jgi:tetratricopeptide (TPR) repeat protein
LLRLGKAMMNLRLGLGALRVARIAAARFPDSVEAAAMLATALNAGGSPEEALLIAGRQMARRSDELDMAKARALLATERFAELDAFARAALLPRVTLPPATVQHLFLPPAELSLLWHRVNTPSEREYETHAAGIREALERSESPFLRRMMELWLAAHDGGCAPADTDPDVWESCGRDPVEKATALNQLALLLCGAGRNVEAREAARRAAAALPASPELWHMLVGLSAGDPAVIARGREACPLDPDLWLAELVASIRAAGPPAEWTGDEAGRTRDWIAGEMRAAGDRFPSAAIARAGDFLFRNGLRREAGLASKASMTGASGLLPVYVLAIRCALSQGNTQDAMDKTRLAIDASIRPPPILFEKIVDLKSAGEMATDPEMVEALRNLRISDPDNPRWAQMLGYVRFKRGGWEIVDALLQMDSALNAGATNKTPYVVAAEVSRLLGNTDRAAEYLRKALAAHPDDLDLINNLVYTLAFSPEGSAEAVRMVPDLLARDPDNIQVLDTAAVVFLRAGRPADAEVLVHSLLKKAPPGTVGWFRASMYAASIALRKGRAVEADVTLREILRKAGTVPDEDVLAASRMLVEAQGLKDAPQAETGQGQSGTAEGNASP